jgi:tRNA pseudouridine38-40 synthase
VRTVQGELELALSKLLNQSTRIDLAGRTDTGVHAVAQSIAFDMPTYWQPAELLRSLRAILPTDITVTQMTIASSNFHPRFNALGRRYEYAVAINAPDQPFLQDRAWILDGDLDVSKLSELALLIQGKHAFAAFAKRSQVNKGTICLVESALWSVDSSPLIRFEIVANRFLHHMVRYLVGTCVEIAMNRRPQEDLELLLENSMASRPVFPAPSSGLYLTGVRYPEGWNRPAGIPWLGLP